MRYTKSFIKTTKQAQSDAEIISHKLMYRAGMIRKLASGIYEWLPFGYKALKNVEAIIRREMNKKECQELFLPALQPKELWEKSGRWEIYGKELVRLNDRHEREFCLGPTHEEVITDLVASEVSSYRDLPVTLYQFQTKFRDEIRPRFGVMRAREFLMKDAYSFDRTDSGAETSYKNMHEIYTNIFKSCGLEFKIVEADSGAIGGNFSHEFMVTAKTGESEIAACECGYAANTEKAVSKFDDAKNPEETKNLELVHTPNKKTIDEISEFLNENAKKFIKTLIYVENGKYCAVLIRGDREVNEFKLANKLNAKDLRLATSQEVFEKFACETGFLGPKDLPADKIICDESVKNLKNAISGANKKDFHYKNLNLGRDFSSAEFFDILLAKPGDSCVKCGKKLEFSRGIEVGHIFKLGTKYSKAMNAEYLDDDGQRKSVVMGCYGIGVSRVVAAAIEQNNDEKGVIWTWALAPYKIGIICLDVKNQELFEISEKLYEKLQNSNYDVLFDDRDERPGIKFNDFDLLGIPVIITLGKKFLESKNLEIKIRKTGEVFYKTIDELQSFISDISKNL